MVAGAIRRVSSSPCGFCRSAAARRPGLLGHALLRGGGGRRPGNVSRHSAERRMPRRCVWFIFCPFLRVTRVRIGSGPLFGIVSFSVSASDPFDSCPVIGPSAAFGHCRWVPFFRSSTSGSPASFGLSALGLWAPSCGPEVRRFAFLRGFGLPSAYGLLVRLRASVPLGSPSRTRSFQSSMISAMRCLQVHATYLVTLRALMCACASVLP